MYSFLYYSLVRRKKITWNRHPIKKNYYAYIVLLFNLMTYYVKSELKCIGKF